MVKHLTFDTDARESVLRGVSKLAKAVVSTLGPRGRNAVLDKGWGGPTVTKDGVSVAEEIELENAFENMGAKLVKEANHKNARGGQIGRVMKGMVPAHKADYGYRSRADRELGSNGRVLIQRAWWDVGGRGRAARLRCRET